MDDLSRRNLSESLATTAEDLAELAREVMTENMEDGGTVDHLASIAERCGDDCREAGKIIRNTVVRAATIALPPRRIPADRPGTHRTPRDASS